MEPDFDPNAAIENAIKADGEFLRDVDKGMSSTETAHGIDLGTVRADSEVMDELTDVSNEGVIQPDDVAARQQADSEAFVAMGRTIHRERIPQEKPVNVTADPAEIERLTFPGEQHQTEVRGSMQSFLREDREYKASVAETFWRLAEMCRQMRLELDQVHGYLERIDL